MDHGLHHGTSLAQMPRQFRKYVKEMNPELYERLMSGHASIEDITEESHDDGIGEMLQDWFPVEGGDSDNIHDISTLKDMATLPLYDHAKVSTLSACLLILNMQVKHGWTNNSVSDLFRFAKLIYECFSSMCRFLVMTQLTKYNMQAIA